MWVGEGCSPASTEAAEASPREGDGEGVEMTATRTRSGALDGNATGASERRRLEEAGEEAWMFQEGRGDRGGATRSASRSRRRRRGVYREVEFVIVGGGCTRYHVCPVVV